MKRALAFAAALVVVAAGLPGCIAIGSHSPDPIHAAKLSDLERRMDKIEERLPK